MHMPTNTTGTSTTNTTLGDSIMGTGVTNIARNPLTSVCSPLGVQLPQTMRAKIVNSELVDFGLLLEKREHLGKDDTQYSLAVMWGKGDIIVARVEVKTQHKFCPVMDICFFDFFGSLP